MLVLGAVVAANISVALAAPPGLSPGPWRLAAQGTASGRAAEVSLLARWTPTEEFGPETGQKFLPPIPKRMAFTIGQPPGQKASVRWTAFCYPDREHGFPFSGTTTARGNRTIYPKLYAQRVECDLYVVATVHGSGAIRVKIYGY